MRGYIYIERMIKMRRNWSNEIFTSILYDQVHIVHACMSRSVNI